MSSLTQKYRSFVSEPMKDKDVTEIPGIGTELGNNLRQNGYERASALFGQFLVMNKNELEFENWLKANCKANNKQAGDCYRSFKEWSDAYI